MANTLYNQLSQFNSYEASQMNSQMSTIANNAKNLSMMFKCSSNPYAALESIINTNPQLSGVMSMIKGGANPQELFYRLAAERGVNPDQLLNIVKSCM